ncbi:ABC transporter permease [Amycolatopsis minnesotensis]|uniref:ABC transporter permease n=1 Tax=Amycolatopsis minnesotensis TaxID=337894 RepID=A0ABP5CZ07_9PSEU
MSTISPARAVRLVVKRELNTRLRTRSFLVGTGLVLVLMIGFILLQSSTTGGTGTSRIGLSGQAIGISGPLRAIAADYGLRVEPTTVPSAEEARRQVTSGDLDAAVSGTPSDLTVLVKSDLNGKLRSALARITQQQVLDGELSAAGLNPAQVMGKVSGANLTVSTVEPPDPDKEQRSVLGFAVVVLLYMGIVGYGALVTQGVVEEKSSRVVEILLSTLRPWQLMLGKVLGLALVGLTQLVIIGAVGLALAKATGVLTIPGVAAGALVWAVVWYLLGFLLYATVFAAAGSLVSRQEDAQSVVAPVSITLVVVFLIGLNALAKDPGSTTSTVLSLVPVFSPMLMPGRIATGAASGLEITAALLLTVLCIGLLTWLAGRIYQNAVLRTGSRVSLRAALTGR